MLAVYPDSPPYLHTNILSGNVSQGCMSPRNIEVHKTITLITQTVFSRYLLLTLLTWFGHIILYSRDEAM